MSTALLAPPVAQVPVPEPQQPSVAPTRAETNPLNTSTGTPVTQAQGANLSDVEGIKDIMTNLVTASNGQRVDVDYRDGQQFVVNLGDRQVAATLEPTTSEGNAAVFKLVSTAGQVLATFVVSYDSSATPPTHVATVRPADSLTLTGVAPQDFGAAASSPQVDQTLTALAAVFPPRSSYQGSRLPSGSALTYERSVDGGTVRVTQGEGSDTRRHNSTEVTFIQSNGDDIYLQFVKRDDGSFLIRQAYAIAKGSTSESGRRNPTAEEISMVMGHLQSLSTRAGRNLEDTTTTSTTTPASPRPSQVSQERTSLRTIFQGLPEASIRALEQSADLDRSQMIFDESSARGSLVYPNGQTVAFSIQRGSIATERRGSDLASAYLSMVQNFQNYIGSNLPDHQVTQVSIFADQTHPTGSNFSVELTSPDGQSALYDRNSLDRLIQSRNNSSTPSNR